MVKKANQYVIAMLQTINLVTIAYLQQNFFIFPIKFIELFCLKRILGNITKKYFYLEKFSPEQPVHSQKIFVANFHIFSYKKGTKCFQKNLATHFFFFFFFWMKELFINFLL